MEIGVGVIFIVVFLVNIKNGVMECLCYKVYVMVDIWIFKDNFINNF